jgi:hypothetical protein
MIRSRRLRWEGHVACMEEGRCACRVLDGKREKKRPLGRRRSRWEYNVKIGLSRRVTGTWTGLL